VEEVWPLMQGEAGRSHAAPAADLSSIGR